MDLSPVLLALAAFALRNLDPDPTLAAWARRLQSSPDAQAAAMLEIRRANGLAGS